MICRPDNDFKCVELCVKVFMVTLQARTAANSGDAGIIWRRQQGGEEAKGVGEGGGVQGAGAGPSQTACSWRLCCSQVSVPMVVSWQPARPGPSRSVAVPRRFNKSCCRWEG